MTTTVIARSKARPAGGNPRKKRRPSWRRKAFAVVAIVLILALVAGSLWIIYFWTLSATKRVNVAGTHQLTPTQVSFAVQIRMGVPLARQNLDEIAQRAMTLSAIESATARRHWPNTITVTIVERRPVFGIHQPDGYLLVDKSGVAYQTQQSLPPDVVLANVDASNAPLLGEVAGVAAALPDKLRRRVDLIAASSRDNVVLILATGRRVTWGSATDSELKAQVVTALLKRKPKLSSIDVSSPHNPAVK